MAEYETLPSLHGALCAARDPRGTAPFLRRIEAGLSPPVPRGRLLLAEPSHPDAGPGPTAHAPDRFELLRRAKDLVVGLSDARNHDGETLPGLFCQFDKETGWPEYRMKEDGGPVPDGICKIDETAARGISVRQLLAMYELVKRRCKVDGWTGSRLQPDDTYKYDGKGTPLTPETVTLYDLNEYVIMPATKAHQCSYVELVTGAGEEDARHCPDEHVPMARTSVYEVKNTNDYTKEPEEVSCTHCDKKLKPGATYWVCHRCGEKHKLCSACAPAPAPVTSAKLQEPLWFASHSYGRRRSPHSLRSRERIRRVLPGGGSPSSYSSRASSSTHATGTTSPATTTRGSISSTGCARMRTTSTRTPS